MVLDVEFFVNQSSPQKHCRVCKKVASPLWEENLLDEKQFEFCFQNFFTGSGILHVLFSIN